MTVLAGHLQTASAVFAAVAVGLMILDDRSRLAPRSFPPWRRHLPLVAGLSLLGVALALRALLDLVLLIDLAVAGTVLVATYKLAERARGRAAASGRRTQVIAACDALVAELHSGRPPQGALEQVAQEWPELAPVASAARPGADVPDALREVATRPGAEALLDVAAAWQVSSRSGASLAGVLDMLSATLRDQQDLIRETAAAVAPARATAHLLAVLPVVGLGLGVALGGDPLHVLLRTAVGSLLLLVGTSLALAGVLWVERLVTSVEN